MVSYNWYFRNFPAEPRKSYPPAEPGYPDPQLFRLTLPPHRRPAPQPLYIVNLPPRKMMGQESQGMLISAVHREKGEEVLHLLMVDDAIPAGAKLC